MLWQVRYASLTEAVRLLGCFDAVTDIQPTSAVLADLKPPSEDTVFSRLFHELALLVVTGLFSYWTIIHTHTHTHRCRHHDNAGNEMMEHRQGDHLPLLGLALSAAMWSLEDIEPFYTICSYTIMLMMVYEQWCHIELISLRCLMRYELVTLVNYLIVDVCRVDTRCDMCGACLVGILWVFVCLYVCLCVSDSGLHCASTSALSAGVPQCLVSATYIYRCLYDMALDVSDR